MRISFCDSAVSLKTGMPVHIETMSAISSSPTCGWSTDSSACQLSSSSRFFCVSFRSLSRSDAAFSNSCASIASSFSPADGLVISSSSSRYRGGAVLFLMRMRDAASSIRSMALSGR